MKTIPFKNTGLILEALKKEDFIFGSDNSIESNFGGVPLQSDGDWRPFAPVGEIQHHKEFRFDSNGCVSHGTLNVLEILLQRVHDKKINLSDRFVAKGSGTNPARGNTPKAVSDFIRHQWSVLEDMWPREGIGTIEEYYAELPKEMIRAAKILKGNHIFGYEYVNPFPNNLRAALKYSPIGMAVGFNGVDSRGLWTRGEALDGHWLTLLHIDDAGVYTVLDSYEPFIKRVHPDFQSTYTYRYYLDAEQYNALMQLLLFLREKLFKLKFGYVPTI